MPADRLSIAVTPGIGDVGIRSSNGPALGAALSALVHATAREAPEALLALRVSGAPGEDVVEVLIGPAADATSPAGGLGAAPERVVAFTRSGLGLSLVLASYVLASHRASVAPAGPGTVSVLIPTAGESP
jgi:hypothetical protein